MWLLAYLPKLLCDLLPSTLVTPVIAGVVLKTGTHFFFLTVRKEEF